MTILTLFGFLYIVIDMSNRKVIIMEVEKQTNKTEESATTHKKNITTCQQGVRNRLVNKF